MASGLRCSVSHIPKGLGRPSWSTDFSTALNVLPSWNGIGLTIPVKVGNARRSVPPGANDPPAIEGAQPIDKELSDRQRSYSMFQARRAGNVLLSGPACFMDISAASNADSAGWGLYLSSLVDAVPNWSPDKARAVISEFMRCKDSVDKHTPCNVFVQNIIRKVFGIDDFGFQQPEATANTMADYMAHNPALWESLGNGESQAALTRAQAEANSGKAVIAVWNNPGGHGHVALIIPGALRPSSSWHSLLVPNAAQVSLNDLSRAWIGRPLSESFGPDKQKNVIIYVRR